jgi:hypothetical protein
MMTKAEVIAAMVEFARSTRETRSHHAFEMFRYDFGVKWSETKPVIRPPEASEPVKSEAE